MNSTVVLTTTIQGKNGEENSQIKIKCTSTCEETGIYEGRARDFANIIAYDKEHYGDVNVETVIHACEIAGIITIDKKLI
jgi:hypothetical protein